MSHARDLDQFYTAPEVALKCAEIVRQYVPHLSEFHLVEPSAGTGAFLGVIPECKMTAIDIEPKHPAIASGNFLEEFGAPKTGRALLTIGNPPFGKQSRTAIKFFNRAAEFSTVIAFIVPKTFRKPSVTNRLNLRFHLVADVNLPNDSFIFKGRRVSVPTCFQVWFCRQQDRKPVRLSSKDPDFDFCAQEDADFAVRRIGARAGCVVEDFAGFATSSHLYVRAHIDPELLKARFRALDFSKARSENAGVPCVTKAELVELYARQTNAERCSMPNELSEPLVLPSLSAVAQRSTLNRAPSRKALGGIELQRPPQSLGLKGGAGHQRGPGQRRRRREPALHAKAPVGSSGTYVLSTVCSASCSSVAAPT